MNNDQIEEARSLHYKSRWLDLTLAPRERHVVIDGTAKVVLDGPRKFTVLREHVVEVGELPKDQPNGRSYVSIRNGVGQDNVLIVQESFTKVRDLLR
jgi:hypothetical protein